MAKSRAVKKAVKKAPEAKAKRLIVESPDSPAAELHPMRVDWDFFKMPEPATVKELQEYLGYEPPPPPEIAAKIVIRIGELVGANDA